MSRLEFSLKITPLDAKLFEPSLMKDHASMECALRAVSRCVGAAAIEQTLEFLLRRPYLAELIWSASNAETSERLTTWVEDNFPLHPNRFFGSVAEKLLSRLSSSLLSVSYPGHTPANLQKFRQDILTIFPVLEALSSSQYAKHVSLSSVVDIKLFQRLKLAIPTSLAEANKIGLELLPKLRKILQYYMSILRHSNLTVGFTSLYITGDTDSPRADVSMEATTGQGSDTYPAVQPMNAALYFESPAGFGEWRVLISSRAEKNLRQIRRQDGKIFLIMLKKIRDLSNGHFSRDNQKPLTESDIDIPIFRAKMTGDARLVYHIDCVVDSDMDVERQVLRVFGIYSLAELNSLKSFWTSVSKQLSKKGKGYEMKCTFRNKQFRTGDTTTTLPAVFPAHFDEDTHQKYPPHITLNDTDLEELHSILVLEKFVNLSQTLLYSMFADLDAAHVFEVVPKEKEIIEHKSSCYVIGRSGTGKTTAMLFKMLLIERSSRQLSLSTIENPSTWKPRQLFVTQSRMLADKVEEYFRSLLQSIEAAALSPSDLKQLAVQVKSKKDRKKQPQGEEEILADHDDLEDWKGSLPTKFSLLRDEHFPLFITYDRLCALIEADIFSPSDKQHNSTKTSRVTRDLQSNLPEAPVEEVLSTDYMQQRRASFVSYDVFLESYWSHFPQPLINGLNPVLVFGEFMGVIKGSEQALNCTNGFLDRQVYMNLSCRSQAMFADRREQIYNLFEVYSRLKRSKGDRDAADRTHKITRHFREHGVPGQKIDYLYVDEVQDNLLIDSLVLRSITRNRDGLFWAGDTAQTIAVGSAFRFTDLKAFQYRIEERIENDHPNIPPMTKPKEFQLVVNFRSHAGIVNCAYSVIELLQKLWPYSIDVLSAEEGTVNGKKPILFTHGDGNQEINMSHYKSIFVKDSGIRIELGAQQCIIVRDDVVKKRLQQEVGGLVLTVYESKGLEFDDVILWNFFQDSTASSSQWRVILNEVDLAQRNHIHLPEFDYLKHAGICSELKFLYVAITRSRKNLWIFDSCEESEPMKIYWKSKGTIDIGDPSSTNLSLAVKSSKEEWSRRGEDLFHNRNFSEASFAFYQADRYRDAAVADAYELRKCARSTWTANRANAFVYAAQAFMRCGNDTNDGQIQHRKIYLKIAAECWGKSGNNRRAAETFMEVEKYTLAAQHHRQAEMFDEMVDVLNIHKVDIESIVATHLMDDAKKFYFKGNQLEKGLSLCSSNEDALEFMKRHSDLNNVRANFLEILGNTIEAAEVHLMLHHIPEAVRLFRGVLTGLWQRMPFRTTWGSSDVDLAKRLEKSSRIKTKLLLASERNEILMFRYIATADTEKLAELGQAFYSLDNVPAALLCFDHIFDKIPLDEGFPWQKVKTFLRLFSDYIHLLNRIRSLEEPFYNKTCQKLFGLQHTDDDLVVLPQNPFLCKHTAEQGSREGVIVSRRAFQEIFSRSLLDHMKARIPRLILAEAFVPCICLVTTGRCDRSKSECRSLHTNRDATTVGRYNERIEELMREFRNLQLLTPEEKSTRNRALIGTLYETLNPPVYKLGSRGNIVPSYIPCANEGFKAIKDSIRDVCQNLIPTLQPEETSSDISSLTWLMQTVTMAFAFDGDEALSYLPSLKENHHRPHCFMKDDSEGGCVAGRFVSSLQADSRDCILDGIKFLEYILTNRIVVEIGVICDFMDWLAGLIVLSFHFYTQGSLHHVVLPRTWFLNLSRIFNKLGDKNGIGATQSFTALAKILLEQIDSTGLTVPVVYLTIQGKNLHQTGLRNMYISRVCRCICLLGGNIPDNNIRQQVLKIVKSLRDEAHPLYRTYASVNTWDDLRKVVLASTIGSSLDEMICLRHAARQREPVPTPRFVRSDVVYWKMGDIAARLAFGPGHSTTPTTHSPAAERLLKLWDACLVESKKIQWVSRRYELYFLGPLAYVLLYLEGADNYICSALGEQPPRHGVGAQSDSLRVVSEKTAKLKEILAPTSELHRRPELTELERQVVDVKNLFEELPSVIQEEYADDLSFAVKLFLTRPVSEIAVQQGQEEKSL